MKTFDCYDCNLLSKCDCASSESFRGCDNIIVSNIVYSKVKVYNMCEELLYSVQGLLLSSQLDEDNEAYSYKNWLNDMNEVLSRLFYLF